MAMIQDSMDRVRRLQTETCDSVDWSDAHNIAQIAQGTLFLILAIWLIFANNAKVAVGQKAPLEQRHAVCATLSTAVALFSGFFNIMQLTGIDDFDIPGYSGGFVLQLARPVEWVLTCPILQLKLVVLAGARVPSYRRFMMPLLSAAVLLCGVAATFTEGALRYVWPLRSKSLSQASFVYKSCAQVVGVYTRGIMLLVSSRIKREDASGFVFSA